MPRARIVEGTAALDDDRVSILASDC